MNIIFALQGEEVYNISLPNNTKSALFEMSADCYVYNDISVKLPTISKIEFLPDNTTSLCSDEPYKNN